ncbi:hypothetical protein F5B17DRAFT_379395 [Nemania serpens]|nr:hypothetical protein F5B17DRAFT_379395 [Nemania serpens]
MIIVCFLLFSSASSPPWETELHNHASHRFHDICQHFDTCSRLRLVRSTYECSLSQNPEITYAFFSKRSIF